MERKTGRPASVGERHKRSMAFPLELYRQFEELAREEERPVSSLVFIAMRKLLKERQKDRAA